MSREQLLIRALAGPGVNVGLAMVAWLVSNAVSGSLRPVLFTLAAVSALQILNLIPHWGIWGPLRKGVPSDGLQALCLIRRRALPPPPATGAAHGLKDPVGRSQAIGMVVALVVGALLAARAIPVDAVYIFAGLALQQSLDARPASVDDEPMKICPSCGAEIRQAARLCYCNHAFDPQPLHTPMTGPPARKSSQPTGHLGRIVLYGTALVIVTITLLLIHNELTCGRHACNAPAQSAAPGRE
jgi:hypothetical protein